MPSISVIVCTYNPDPVIFRRCLMAILEAASVMPPGEIILIDNNSTQSIADHEYIKEFLQMAPGARIVIEKKQGLTPARLLGIKEAKGELLVFIDDDNIIDTDFFQKGSAIAADKPNIGAWSGQVLLEFEKPPEPWTKNTGGCWFTANLKRIPGPTFLTWKKQCLVALVYLSGKKWRIIITSCMRPGKGIFN